MPHILFTDGACSGNPGPGGWAAVIATDAGEVQEYGAYFPDATNNQMELVATIEGLRRLAGTPGDMIIGTDSRYVIDGATTWIRNWEKNNWRTSDKRAVINRVLWEQLDAEIKARGEDSIDWRYVRGHRGTPGNVRADQIAVAFSLRRPLTLYSGPLSAYTYDLTRFS